MSKKNLNDLLDRALALSPSIEWVESSIPRVDCRCHTVVCLESLVTPPVKPVVSIMVEDTALPIKRGSLLVGFVSRAGRYLAMMPLFVEKGVKRVYGRFHRHSSVKTTDVVETIAQNTVKGVDTDVSDLDGMFKAREQQALSDLTGDRGGVI